jgi:hypothetical protein
VIDPAGRHARAVPLHESGLPAGLAWPLVAVLTGVSLFLGFFDLTKRSLWFDEGYTWLTADQTTKGIFAIARQQGYHLIPYYLLVHLSISRFGDSAFVMRAPSVVAGAATVPLFYLLVCRLGGRIAGLYAVVLMIVSEPFVFWQQNARDYAFVVFLAVGSMLAAAVAVQRSRVWPLLFWVVVTGVGAYTHPETLLMIPAQLVVMMVWSRSGRVRLAIAGLTAGGAVVSLPILLEAAHSSVYQTTPLLPPAVGSATEIATFLASGAGTGAPVTSADHALLGLTFAIVVVAVGMLAVDLVDHGCTPYNLGLGLSLAWLISPSVLAWIASETGHPDFLDRYVILSLPGAAATVALVLIRIRPRLMGVAGLIYLTIFRAGVLIPSYHYSLDNFRYASSYIVERTRPSDCITFSSNAARILWDYYTGRVEAAGHRRPVLPTQELPLVADTSPAGILSVNDLSQVSIDYFQGANFVAETHVVCTRMWLFESHAGRATGSPGSVALYRSLLALEHNLGEYYHPVNHLLTVGVEVTLYDRIPDPAHP